MEALHWELLSRQREDDQWQVVQEVLSRAYALRESFAKLADSESARWSFDILVAEIECEAGINVTVDGIFEQRMAEQLQRPLPFPKRIQLATRSIKLLEQASKRAEGVYHAARKVKRTPMKRWHSSRSCEATSSPVRCWASRLRSRKSSRAARTAWLRLDPAQAERFARRLQRVLELPDDRLRNILREIESRKAVSRETLEWCRHIELLQNLTHAASPEAHYARPPCFVGDCKRYHYRSQIEHQEFSAVIDTFKRAYCASCPGREVWREPAHPADGQPVRG